MPPRLLPFPGLPSAVPVPLSFFLLSRMPVGTYKDFTESAFGSSPTATIVKDANGPYPTNQRIHAPIPPFDHLNWYFLTVRPEGADASIPNTQIAFYDGDYSWITTSSMQFGDDKFYGIIHLRNIGNRFCVQVSPLAAGSGLPSTTVTPTPSTFPTVMPLAPVWPPPLPIMPSTLPPTGGIGQRRYPGVPTALPVPPSFFAFMPQSVGRYAEFTNSYFGDSPGGVIIPNAYGPYPDVLRVYAPRGFDRDNWYFLTVENANDGGLKIQTKIIFYEGPDTTWLTQGDVEFGIWNFYGMVLLLTIGTRFCVGFAG